MPFRNYNDRDQGRRRFWGAAAVGAGVALLIPGARRSAASLLLRGAEAVGHRFGGAVGPSRLAQTAAEISTLFDRSIPRAAQASAAAQNALGVLEENFFQAGGGRTLAKAHARRVVHSNAFRGFLFGGRLDDFLAHGEISTLLEERVAGIHRPGLLPHRVREVESAALHDALRAARQAMPGLEELADDPFFRQVNQDLRGMTRRELSRQARWRQGAPARIARLFGVEGVTLGEKVIQERQAEFFGPFSGVLEQLSSYGDPLELNQLSIGGVYRIAGREYDLRGFQSFARNSRNWLQSNLQIPLVPGKDGISPFQLFPWRHGGVDRTFSHLGPGSMDPALAGILGHTGERVGQDVFKVGHRLAAVDFENEALTRLRERGSLRSALYGYGRRRAETIVAAQAARAEGGAGGGLRGWLGLAPEQLGQSRLASVWTKFRPDSDWAPALMRRILAADPETVPPDEIRRMGRFLTKQGLSPAAQRALVESGRGKFGDSLQAFAQGLASDESVLDFFRQAASEASAGIESRFQSGELNGLVAQFRASPQGLLSRFEPAERHSFFGFNWAGHAPDRRGIDLMRAGIVSEVEARIAAVEGEEAVLGVLRRADLSPAEREQAYGYFRGKQLLRRLQSRRGPVEAMEWLQSHAMAQGDIERATARKTRWWHPFEGQRASHLGTSELFLKDPVSFLGAMNRARKAGASWRDAFTHTVFGDWGGQYASFFTGNQRHATATTWMLEHLPRSLADRFSEAGLGLPAADLLSGGSILKNLFLKRIVPAVGAVEGYRYADYALRRFGLPGPSDLYANLRARAGRSRAKQFGTRIPGLGRRALFPGLEKFLPERDLHEEIRHQQSGVEPVRRGRFWLDGSRAEFWGEKVDYYLPSAVRTARSHWQEAGNVDLNSGSYWRHSWIPNPNNLFLGPFAWLLDRYWWENQHREDRPYTISGEPFDPNTPHGSVLNPTLGRLLKPRRILAPGYLPKEKGGLASREALRALNEAQKAGLDLRGAGLLAAGGAGAGPGGGPTGAGGFGSPGVLGPGTTQIQGSVAQITAGGQLVPLSLPGGLDPDGFAALGKSTVQKTGYGTRLSRAEIARLNRAAKAGLGGLSRLNPSALTRLADQRDPFGADQLDMLDYADGTVTGLKNLSDLAGIYGYFARTGLDAAGRPLVQRGPVIASPSRAYGWARRWYDLSLGGLGGELNEVGRRFLGHPHQNQEYNPIPNRMPAWLPGPEGLVDYRHGDPFVKIPRGELRLPGESFERTHDVRLLHTRASSIGKSVPELMREMLSLHTPMSAYGEEATEVGTEMHHALEARWKKMGILLAAEARVENEALGISGHYDAILRVKGAPLLVDIKTVNQHRFEQARKAPFAEHVSQVNFYLHEAGIQRGALLYVNRDRPQQLFMQPVRKDDREMTRTIGRVEQARSNLKSLVRQGVLTQGDLYDGISRFEILADVAPYSENYAQARDFLTSEKAHGQLSEAENARFQAAKERVAQQKKRLTLYPYRFRGASLKTETVTVDRIVDPNHFTIREDERSIRLAGVTASRERIEQYLPPAPDGVSAEEWQFRRFGVRRGARIQIQVEGDPLHANGASRAAVVHARGKNVNQELLRRGLAEERENDFSDTGVAARFTPAERWKGALWERLAHLDTPFHSKFLRVRSPLEELERGIVYGKSTGGWRHPLRDYLWPTVSAYSAKHPLVAAAAMGGFARIFFSKAPAKNAAFLYGAAVGGGLASLRAGLEFFSGTVWKPPRTHRREALEEYWDTLKYVKYRGLAQHEADLAKEEEGIDIDRMTRELYEQGQGRTRRKRWLQKISRAAAGRKNEPYQRAQQLARDEIRELSEPRGMLKLGPHATRALQYQELYRSTFYGLPEGEAPFRHLFRAFPKYKRELLDGFINGSNARERERIYALLPKHEQRAIAPYLGIDPARAPGRPELNRYFQDHVLPDEGWAGWRADTDLEQLRQVAIHREALDPMESGLFPAQIDEAEASAEQVPVPTLKGGTAGDLREHLNGLLSGRGLENLSVHVEVAPHDEERVEVEMRVKKRREREIRRALQMSHR